MQHGHTHTRHTARQATRQTRSLPRGNVATKKHSNAFVIKAISVFIVGAVMFSASHDVIFAELRALKVAQPALFFAPVDEGRDVVPAICEALNHKISGSDEFKLAVKHYLIGSLLDEHEMLIPTNFLHLLPQPLQLLLL